MPCASDCMRQCSEPVAGPGHYSDSRTRGASHLRRATRASPAPAAYRVCSAHHCGRTFGNRTRMGVSARASNDNSVVRRSDGSCATCLHNTGKIPRKTLGGANLDSKQGRHAGCRKVNRRRPLRWGATSVTPDETDQIRAGFSPCGSGLGYGSAPCHFSDRSSVKPRSRLPPSLPG
jgi:hypothetical protein